MSLDVRQSLRFLQLHEALVQSRNLYQDDSIRGDLGKFITCTNLNTTFDDIASGTLKVLKIIDKSLRYLDVSEPSEPLLSELLKRRLIKNEDKAAIALDFYMSGSAFRDSYRLAVKRFSKAFELLMDEAFIIADVESREFDIRKLSFISDSLFSKALHEYLPRCKSLYSSAMKQYIQNIMKNKVKPCNSNYGRYILPLTTIIFGLNAFEFYQLSFSAKSG